MPNKLIERLMFAQGGQCFFCRKPLPKAEASIEHLIAVSHGGKDNDENCVACCKALNTLFGCMSLKEKLNILLNQRGSFVCPTGSSADAKPKKSSVKPTAAPNRTPAEKVALVVANLHKSGNAKPRTVQTLMNTIKTRLQQFGEPENEAEIVFKELTAKGYINVVEEKVIYALPPEDV